MTERGQQLTAATYENSAVVEKYVDGARHSKMLDVVDSFSRTLPGVRRVIDIGCGPGHHAYRFAENGCLVTGIDASPTMITAAKKFKPSPVPGNPSFQEADMRQIGEMFPTDSFDGAWISDSLFHVPKDEALPVLAGIRKIVINNGPVFIALKEGNLGTRIIEDHKYGQPTYREFTFWEKDKFQALVESAGFSIDDIQEAKMGTTGGEPTKNLRFFLRVQK